MEYVWDSRGVPPFSDLNFPSTDGRGPSDAAVAGCTGLGTAMARARRARLDRDDQARMVRADVAVMDSMGCRKDSSLLTPFLSERCRASLAGGPWCERVASGSVARAAVLTAVGPVVVGTVAGAVVVVVLRVEEVDLAAVAVTQQGVAFRRSGSECHGDGVASCVAAAHRLTPVAHLYS